MAKRIVRTMVAGILSLSSGATLFQDGCGGGYYSDDCIGADGYNWCLAGSWDGQTIHEPSVPLLDFTDGGTYGSWE